MQTNLQAISAWSSFVNEDEWHLAEWLITAGISRNKMDSLLNLKLVRFWLYNDLWHHNPVECIQELLGNPLFKDDLGYIPQRVYRDARRTNREYSEMWTANW